jgi:hypothetical protein
MYGERERKRDEEDDRRGEVRRGEEKRGRNITAGYNTKSG